MTVTNPIERCFELAAERCGDLTPLVCGVIAETVRDLLNTDWSPEIDAAWRKLLDEIKGVVAQHPA
jgi:hypothetical protein